MRQFQNYPIFVNYYDDALDEKRAARNLAVDQGILKGNYERMNWIDGNGAEVFEIRKEDPRNQSDESKEYERQVEEQLRMIGNTLIGLYILSKFSADNRIWILPKRGSNRKPDDYTADTFPGDPKAGGGILIHYEPTTARQTATESDILFHEIVHAYRIHRVGYSDYSLPLTRFGGNYDEFFAFIIQNMYISTTSAKVRYSYRKPYVWAYEETQYESLTRDFHAFAALQFYMQEEFALAECLGRWQKPTYNPFRDFETIKKQALEEMVPPATLDKMKGPFTTSIIDDFDDIRKEYAQSRGF